MLYLPKDKVAVIPLHDPDKTASGLYIPEVAKERSDQGIVKYVGPDVKDVQIGDHVFFSGYDGTQVAIEGEGIMIFLVEKSIQAIIHLGENPVVEGLYFIDERGDAQPATYELAIQWLTDTIQTPAMQAIRTGKRIGGSAPGKMEAEHLRSKT